MNVAVLVGRLTRDPDVRYTTGGLAIARYTLAVDRRFKRDGEADADFIPCVAFGKQAEFAEKYFQHGYRVAVSGRIQTGSYTDKEGRKVYTTEVIVENHEFAQSKSEAPKLETRETKLGPVDEDGFMKVPDGMEEELPFV